MKIAVLTPFQNRLTGIYYWVDLLNLLFHLSQTHQICFLINDSVADLPTKRDILANQALSQDADYLLWLDSDMSFNADLFDRLLKHDKDIVSGVYVDRYGVVINKLVGQKPIPIDMLRQDKLIDTESTGFGCILIKAEVFKRLKKPWFKWSHGRCEDWNFCIKARKSGFKVWTDPTVFVSHGYTTEKDRDIYKFLLYGKY